MVPQWLVFHFLKTQTIFTKLLLSFLSSHTLNFNTLIFMPTNKTVKKTRCKITFLKQFLALERLLFSIECDYA